MDKEKPYQLELNFSFWHPGMQREPTVLDIAEEGTVFNSKDGSYSIGWDLNVSDYVLPDNIQIPKKIPEL